MSTDMDILNDPTDNFDSAFERIESPIDHGKKPLPVRADRRPSRRTTPSTCGWCPVAGRGPTIDGVPVFPKFFGGSVPTTNPEALSGTSRDARLASGITPEFAALRGYETIVNATCLKALGLAQKPPRSRSQA